MEVPLVKSSYTVKDFDLLGFHDCHVHGLRWDNSRYALLLDLDYIVKWVENAGAFQFWLAAAELCFEYASDVRVALDWTNFPMDVRIQEIHKRDVRPTPNGSNCYLWEIELASPAGAIALWATDFRLSILGQPELRENPYLR